GPPPKYAGAEVPPATDFKNLRYYLTCDDIDTKQVKEAVSGMLVGKLGDRVEVTDGVRGKALRMTVERRNGQAERVAGIELDPKALAVDANKPFTLSFWVRRDPAVISPAPQLNAVLAGGEKGKPVLNCAVMPAHAAAMVQDTGPEQRVGRIAPARTHEWTHCALVRDDKNRVAWWVNGGPTAVPATAPAEFAGELAYEFFDLVSPVIGMVRLDIDEFALFDRALTDDELKKLAGKGK
ncbi:MAG TPA: LamG-like jellyroll fold domain-containing protein, partial [Gemmataceae bacterium]|nr:LamG-like jellyroll fold domain-containing protein [Gemmataceae bacterium]